MEGNITNMKSEKRPLITIIVPFYNAERYLEECIKSILNQDYVNIEAILVNDGSKDNSKKIAQCFIDKDVRVKLINQENEGVSTARNRGIDNSKGEYICFIDADDYISKDYISYFYNLIKDNDAEIAITPMPRKFNSFSKIEEEEKNEDTIENWSGIQTAIEMLYYNIVIAPWNKMISKDLIDRYNIRFNKKLSFGEGFNFSVDCFQRAKRVVVGHRKVYNYRVDNPNSVMTRFSMELVTGSIEAQKTIRENLVNRTVDISKACKYANWHTYCDCLNTMIGCKVTRKYKKEYKEIKKLCQRDALCVLKAHITIKEKIKGILYFINPYIIAKIINHFRVRKFTIDENN